MATVPQVSAVLVFALIAAPATAGSFHRDGTAIATGGKAYSASFGIVCSEDSGNTSLSLSIDDAKAHGGFDYASFQGFVAPARGRKLGSLAWTSATGTVQARFAATGLDSVGPPESFIFLTFATVHDQLGETGGLLSDLGAGATTVVWRQTSFEDSRRELVATFELSAADVAQARRAFAPCLAKAHRADPADPS